MNNQNSTFHIGAHSAEALAERFGTPLFVYDAARIRESLSELKEHLGVYPHTEFLYAIKANFNPHIVRLIARAGFGVDAVSLDEVRIGLACGISPKRIMLTENNISDDEMRQACAFGVLINIGSLSRLASFGREFPGSRVCVRINPNIGAASHASNITGGPDSKFGISYREIDAILDIVAVHRLSIIGVHEHIGSGWLSLEEPQMALRVLLSAARRFPELEFVDVGGGFGVPYRPDETPLQLPELGAYMNSRMRAFSKKMGRAISLRVEPGRFAVARAGHLLARVTAVKCTISGRSIAGTDTGMNHLLRPALYGSYHEIVNATNPRGMPRRYDVVGNVCECADYFARDREIPEVREGDILSFENAGAYCMSMASEYQFRALPAEVLVDGQDAALIRPRERFEDRFAVFNYS